VQFDEVHGGSGYLSQNDLRLHFGLGSAATMDSVEVRWPSGAVEKFAHLSADVIYTIVEGKGVPASVPLPPADRAAMPNAARQHCGSGRADF